MKTSTIAWVKTKGRLDKQTRKACKATRKNRQNSHGRVWVEKGE